MARLARSRENPKPLAGQEYKITTSSPFVYMKQLNIILILTILVCFYKFFSHRLPLWGVPSPTISSNPTCRTYHPTILVNCKDIRPLRNNSPWAIISCNPSRQRWSPESGKCGDAALAGELYLWNWRDSPEDAPRLLDFKIFKGDSESDGQHNKFNPLGVTAVERRSRYGNSTVHRLFITNNPKEEATVEVLDLNIERNSYDHIMTIKSPRLWSPGGIVALDDTHFFVTNGASSSGKSKVRLLFETLFGLPLSETVYVSLQENATDNLKSSDSYVPIFQSVGRFTIPRGIEIDREESKLYIASSGNGIWQYSYSPDPTSISTDNLFPLYFKVEQFHRAPYMPDNLMLSSVNGKKRLFLSALGLASGQKIFTSITSFVQPSFKASHWSSSWVLEFLPEVTHRQANRPEVALRAIDPANVALRKAEWRWRSVFWDDGTVYGGISTAGMVELGGGKEGLLAASSIEEGVLICTGGVERSRGWLLEKIW